jgi:DMSO/TMAO reductase YedYZ heme-binding membrane subunit
VKKGMTRPLIYGAIIAVLLLVRVHLARRDSRRTRGASAPAGAKHATGAG